MSDARLLHEFFVRAAARWPDRVSVDVPPSDGRPSRSLVTYAELDRSSNALARRLQPKVVGESIVPILLPRTSAVFAAQLAVLKAGAAYTCIDPAFPDERARAILEDARAVALVTDAAGAERASRARWPVSVVVAGEVTPSAGGPDEAIASPAWLGPASLAYLIYTSGTTGQPKGVSIEHRSIANLVASDLAEFGLTPEARVGQSSSTAYDSSIEEVWLAWSAGATVVVIDDETARSGPDLVAWLQRERISVLCPPPTLLRATGCDDPQRALPNLTLLYVGGEALPRDVADRWARGRRLVNGYGPTECAVTAVRGDVVEGLPVPIGRPVPGAEAWILNDAMEEVASGEHGELYLGGIGLARGYWHRPDLTADRFPVHPRFGRLYRTGDVAHRDPLGTIFCHGRLDSQVKIRGYRVELEEIESCLASCPGVRAAACAVQPSGGDGTLCAFIVPDDPAHPPAADDLRSALRGVLPSYMVPARFGSLSELPVTVGGKLNRAALPTLTGPGRTSASGDAPATEMEVKLETAVRAVLHLAHPAGTGDDFFNDLGGDSLAAAQLVTRLREDRATSWVAVRDVYEARTIAELGRRSSTAAAPAEPPAVSALADPGRGTAVATLCQAAWLLTAQVLGSAVLYLLAFRALPWLTDRLSLTACLMLAPLLFALAVAIYTPLSVVAAVITKRLFIGRYRALRAPVWGAFYVRHWIVVRAAALVPWRILQGTLWHDMALRALGARIGRRVHVHRGVDLTAGGWDLLTIGDDVTIGQDVTIGLVELECGALVVGPVSIGDGSTLDARSGVSGHTVLEPQAHLTALSALPAGGVIPRGERWDGIPARPAGHSAPAPPLDSKSRQWSPESHAVLLTAARAGVFLLSVLPLDLVAIGACLVYDVDASDLWRWIAGAPSHGAAVAAGVGLLCTSVPLTLAMQALTLRMLGRVRSGVMSRWSSGYIRIWLKTGLLQSAGEWLSGTLMWPVWLRAAGMSVGARCEVSSIIDVVADLITIGSDSFLADGIYLGSPRIHRSTVTTAATSLSARTFLGNHVVVPAGQHLPSDILLGVCTVADARAIRPESSWFGHPPFELPRRVIATVDRRFTHEPSAIRYLNRLFWELLRFALPAAPALVIVAWFHALAAAGERASAIVVALVAAPLVGLAAGSALCGFVLVLKWGLLGRVRPGERPLWSCWCSRWDFLYVAWGRYASPILTMLEGTLLLAWYLRAMGMTLGRGLVLGRGFAQVVDPDMITIEDGAAVSANFQAHTFEDRVLKIDRIRIRRASTLATGTVPLYGADIGEGAYVAPHSVIMKHEHLTPGRRYSGAPTTSR